METYLIIAMAALQVADAIVTYKALSLPGVSEGNPIMAKVIDVLGVKGFVAFKLAVAGVMLAYLPTSGVHPLALVGIDAVYVWVVWNNVKIWRKS